MSIRSSIRAAHPFLSARGGAFLMIGSVAGVRGCPATIAYQVVKGALPQMARALACDHGHEGIRVKCHRAGHGAEPRLRIVRLLLASHPEGLVVGEIGAELGIAPSTLSHHLDKLKTRVSCPSGARARSFAAFPGKRPPARISDRDAEATVRDPRRPCAELIAASQRWPNHDQNEGPLSAQSGAPIFSCELCHLDAPQTFTRDHAPTFGANK